MTRFVALLVLKPLLALGALAAILFANTFGAERTSTRAVDDFRPTNWASKVIKALK